MKGQTTETNAAIGLSPLSVLIIEDNPDHQEIIRRAARLSEHRLAFHFAGNLRQALEWLSHNPVDFIVADINLPDGSGLDLLKNQTLEKPTPAVIITNQGSERHAVEAMKLGAADYIVKSPENFRHLPHIIYRAYRDWQNQQKKKQAEEALQLSQKRLAGLYAAAPIGLGFVKDLILVECNASLANILGYDRAEIIGKNILEFPPQPIDLGSLTEVVWKELQNSNMVELEIPLSASNGKTVQSKIRVTYADPEDPDRGIVFSLDDVTEYYRAIKELKQKEEALLKTERLLRQKVEFLQTIHRLDTALSELSSSFQAVERFLEETVHLPNVDAAVFFQPAEAEQFENLTQWTVKPNFTLPEDFLKQFTSGCCLFSNPYKPGFALLPLAQDNPAGLRSALILNLAYNDRQIAMLALLSSLADNFSEEWRQYAESLAIQMSLVLERIALIEGLQKKQKQIEDSYLDTIRLWSKTLDLRDQDTGKHTERVAKLACALAEKMGISGEDLTFFRYGALLHDIGKIRIPDRILLKTESLTEAEWALMRQHPLFAKEVISQIPYLQRALEIPLYHHERWNGCGYPYGLKEKQIPLWARIFSVADVWDALTSDRTYRPAWTREDAKKYIRENAGKLFDPEIVHIFLEIVDRFAE